MATLIVCIKRKAGMTPAEFSTYWRHVHAPLLLACHEFSRHIRSYVQYHMADQDSASAALFGVSGDYDGIAVITFDDTAAIANAFSEPRYLADVRPDESNFIDAANCLSFLADGTVIKAG